MVLSTTAFLIAAGFVSILLMEWHNSLAPFSVPGRFLASFFQAVSARTAGFNTLSIGNLANETLFMMILLMFIGASPGSCGGGIKTTTFASLVILGISRLRGKTSPQIFYRTISQASIGKAISVVLISALIIILGTFLLLMTEIGEVSHLESRGKFLELFFEVISAFGTVGLSTGLTAGLTGIGKIILSFVMFTGRLGPLMIAIAVSRRETSHHRYAEEAIMAG
jgi:trk system potassium uptake protein TrkH